MLYRARAVLRFFFSHDPFYGLYLSVFAILTIKIDAFIEYLLNRVKILSRLDINK